MIYQCYILNSYLFINYVSIKSPLFLFYYYLLLMDFKWNIIVICNDVGTEINNKYI